VGRWEVIDVTVVGGPDVGARRRSVPGTGGTRFELELYATAVMPARVERVGVVVEAPPAGALVAFGPTGPSAVTRHDPRRPRDPTGAWTAPEMPEPALRPGDVRSDQLIVADGGVVGWLGTGRHDHRVVVQRDGWLLTAWADLGGMILGPGETFALDPLWIGDGPPAVALAAYGEAWAADTTPRRPDLALPRAVWGPGAAGLRANAAAVLRASGVGVALARHGDVRSLAVAADAGLSGGVEIDLTRDLPAGPDGGPPDLTRPGTVDQLEGLGNDLAGHTTYVVVVDRPDPDRPEAPWGSSSTTAPHALRRALEALRHGLGPDPVLHLRGVPLGVAAGMADVVEVGPGLVPPGPVRPDPGDVAVAAARRAAVGRALWAAATGPIDPTLVAARLEPYDQAATDQAATDQAATDQAATDQAATDQAATDQAASDQATPVPGHGAVAPSSSDPFGPSGHPSGWTPEAVDAVAAAADVVVLTGEPAGWDRAAAATVTRLIGRSGRPPT
jgi:hypothetical protein